MSDVEAYATLTALAQRSQQMAVELPAKENAQTHWNGLGFSLLGQRFVAPMSEVAELMRLPQATRLPGVKSFVVGVANVRGRLMALLDLAVFFGAKSGLPLAQRRVLAVEDDEQYVGFLVEESLGMQHFPSDSFDENTEDIDIMFQPFVKGSYRIAGGVWPVMSLKTLAEHPSLEKLADSSAMRPTDSREELW
jgi:twitching motility protein PilI